ncbi:ribose-phosphate pyrophosphokinase [Duganella phyllosphaerae]|uniref:Ribose-phosphate pyrophosphokinase n=2 Tax=Telluria group TaxID=2895353 RepID=A0A1E7WNI6_9BURK|nr:ribose-phosphate pyrophosphokinase [Duganella phyllosphaerae]
MVGARLAAVRRDFWEVGMNGKLFQRALNLLLPTSCALCGAGGDDTLCSACVDQFFGDATRLPRCHCCANPVVAGATLCGHCIAARPAFDRTIVAADYALPVDQLVLQLKFGHRLALAALMARRLAVVVGQHPDTLPDVLCAVPLGRRRLAQRGYNQALEIARPLARSLGVVLQPRLLARIRETAAQSSVAPEHRRANIAGAFALAAPALALVRGRHIGVVDDVMTSGGTLDEMAATLKRHGAARVSNFVFARTPPH